MTNTKRRILILGGGFGGIKTALELAGHTDFEVSLLSDQNNFRYYPTLYKTATGGNILASSVPLAEIFEDRGVEIIHDTAAVLDRKNNQLVGSSKKIYSYDVLVISLGVETNFFGIKGLKEYAYGIKSLEEAARLKAHLHKLIADEGKPDLNYVIIGGGPTGVELAGALPSYLKHIMTMHGVQPKKLHIDLVEAAPKLMPRMNKSYSSSVQKRLKKLGVKLYLGQAVQAETSDALMVSGHSIKSHTVVWTAGVTTNSFLKSNHFILNDHGKAIVDQYLQAEDNIYVIGDNADTPYSGMAQTALYDAKFISSNLKRAAKGQTPKIYTPKQPVYVTPVGEGWAAVSWHGVMLSGRLGWLLRELADLLAFHDFEPWRKARRHFIAEFEQDSDCKICTGRR